MKHLFIILAINTRIDQLDDNTYRYASWRKGKNESPKPNLILYNGKMEIQGSGGNHTFTFVSGRYKYMIYRNLLGSDNTPEINLIVRKNTRIILNEDWLYIVLRLIRFFMTIQNSQKYQSKTNSTLFIINGSTLESGFVALSRTL